MDDRNDGQWTVLMLMMMTDAQHGIKLRMAGGSGRMGIGQDTYATVINKLGLWWRHTHNVQFVIRMRNDEFISTSTFHPSILDQLHMLCLRRLFVFHRWCSRACRLCPCVVGHVLCKLGVENVPATEIN